jgi:hypothetical protein
MVDFSTDCIVWDAPFPTACLNSGLVLTGRGRREGSRSIVAWIQHLSNKNTLIVCNRTIMTRENSSWRRQCSRRRAKTSARDWLAGQASILRQVVNLAKLFLCRLNSPRAFRMPTPLPRVHHGRPAGPVDVGWDYRNHKAIGTFRKTLEPFRE